MTSKQRAYLKSIAMTTEPILQIGKSSLTPEFTQSAKEALKEEKRASYITEFVTKLEKDTPVTINKEAWETISFENPIFTKSDIIKDK